MRLRVLLVAVCLAVPLIVAPEAQAAAVPITTCGQVVTTNAVLTQNLHCTGDGVLVGADKITIDLNGFRLRGDRDFSDVGINDQAGFDRVTIKNGVVRNFGAGIYAVSGADRIAVSSMVVSGNYGEGIEIDGDSASVKSSTTSGNVEDGVLLGGTRISVKSVIASNNGSVGILVNGEAASVASSTADGNHITGIEGIGANISIASSEASGNASDGIVISGSAGVLKRNRADGNGFDGQASDLIGLGIYVYNDVTLPSGSNEALGNDDTADCAPASLC